MGQLIWMELVLDVRLRANFLENFHAMYVMQPGFYTRIGVYIIRKNQHLITKNCSGFFNTLRHNFRQTMKKRQNIVIIFVQFLVQYMIFLGSPLYNYCISCTYLCMKMSKKCVVRIMDRSNEKKENSTHSFFIHILCFVLLFFGEGKSKGHHH